MLTGAITLSLLLFFIKEKPHETMTRKATPLLHLWGISILVGLFEGLIPAYLMPLGQQSVDSGVAAIIFGITPIFTIILAGFFVKDDKWRVGSFLSVIIGFVGLIFLFGPQIQGNILADLKGELILLAAAISLSLAIIFMRYMPMESPIRGPRRIVAIAAIPLVISSFIFEDPLHAHYTTKGVTSIIILGSICSGVVYLFFINLVKRAGPTFASLVNYIIPLIGVSVGVLMLHEKLHWNEASALAIIFLAMLCNEIRMPTSRQVTT